MRTIMTIGLDIAKSVFQVHGVVCTENLNPDVVMMKSAEYKV
jgi:hypothetical protein